MHTFSVSRGRRREKLPWVSREHTDVTSSIREYVEPHGDCLLSGHPSVFEKNDRGAGMTRAEVQQTMETSRGDQDPRVTVRLRWNSIASEVGRGKLC